MKAPSRRTMLAAIGAMPIAACPAAAVCVAPNDPPIPDEQDSVERLRWHVEQAQGLLSLLNEHLPQERRPRIVISYWLGLD